MKVKTIDCDEFFHALTFKYLYKAIKNGHGIQLEHVPYLHRMFFRHQKTFFVASKNQPLIREILALFILETRSVATVTEYGVTMKSSLNVI